MFPEINRWLEIYQLYLYKIIYKSLGIMVDDRCARTGVSSKSIVMLDCWRGPQHKEKGNWCLCQQFSQGFTERPHFSPNYWWMSLPKFVMSIDWKRCGGMRQGFFRGKKHIYQSLFTKPWLKHFKMAGFQGPTLNLHPFTISVYHLQ